MLLSPRMCTSLPILSQRILAYDWLFVAVCVATEVSYSPHDSSQRLRHAGCPSKAITLHPKARTAAHHCHGTGSRPQGESIKTVMKSLCAPEQQAELSENSKSGHLVNKSGQQLGRRSWHSPWQLPAWQVACRHDLSTYPCARCQHWPCHIKFYTRMSCTAAVCPDSSAFVGLQQTGYTEKDSAGQTNIYPVMVRPSAWNAGIAESFSKEQS